MFVPRNAPFHVTLHVPGANSETDAQFSVLDAAIAHTATIAAQTSRWRLGKGNVRLLSVEKGRLTFVMPKPFEPLQRCFAAAWFNLGGTCVIYKTPAEFFAPSPNLAQAA